MEQLISKYAEEPMKSVIRPALGLSFNSLGGAYDFYYLYYGEIGLGKRRLNAERTKCTQRAYVVALLVLSFVYMLTFLGRCTT